MIYSHEALSRIVSPLFQNPFSCAMSTESFDAQLSFVSVIENFHEKISLWTPVELSVCVESAFVSAKTLIGSKRIRRRFFRFFVPKSIRILLLDWWKKGPGVRFRQFNWKHSPTMFDGFGSSVQDDANMKILCWRNILLTITQSIFVFNYSLERIFSSWKSSLNIDER